MGKLPGYTGSIDLISGIRQKNNGSFALVEANAIQTRDDGTRLDTELDNIKQSLNNIKIPIASDSIPKMASETGSAGTETTWARADHVHPVQTSIDSAESANKLANSRKIQIDLSSNNSANFNGEADINPGIKGTLSVSNGGTGATTAAEARLNLGVAESDHKHNATDIIEDSDHKFVTEIEKNAWNSMASTGVSGTTNLINGYSIGSIRAIGSKEEDSSYKLGNYAMAEGLDTQSGAKAFTIVGVNKTNKTYTLDSVEGLSVGDVYSAHVLYTTGASSQAENYGKITAINGNVVTVDNLWCEGEFATSDSYISGGYDGEKNTFRIIAKPNVGTRVIGDISHAEGVSTKALSKGSHAEGKGTVAHGSWSHAEGNNTKAAFNAHAEGQNTKAYGYISHAEGAGSETSGYGSHAEGGKTKAIGGYSHTEGNTTQALSESAHAEGQYTTASGNFSHAEGSNTTASEDCSHAEGRVSKALGRGSHAEGGNTTASGDFSHAEGNNNTASGRSSHAEGDSTTAEGGNSHAEGGASEALGSNSHAEGSNTTAVGDNSHAEGYGTNCLGSGSHTEGSSTTVPAGSDACHAEGWKTTASNKRSHAEGGNTTASGDSSHAEGHATNASGSYSHAEGYGTQASADYSHTEGKGTQASGLNSHVQGRYNVIDDNNKYADIIGNGDNNTKRSNAATVDWSGNAWYAGDVYVGSTSKTNKDEGSKKLATEEYVDLAIPSTTYNATIGIEWVGDAAPYTQTVAITGITVNDTPIVDIIPSNTDYEALTTQLEEFGNIYRITTDTNSITIYSTEKTTIEIPIQLKCVK